MAENNKNISKYLLIITLIVFVKVGYSQNSDIQKGDKEYVKEHYYNALNYYKKAISKIPLQSEKILIRIADSYYYISDYVNAIQYFNQVSTAQIPTPQLINYAKILQFNQQYKQAEKLFRKVLKKENKNSLVSVYIQSCKYAETHIDNSIEYNVEKTNLNIYGESFGVQFYKDGIVYATEIDNEKDYVSAYNEVDKNGYQFKNLCFSKYKNDVFEKPELFSDNLTYRYHEGTVCFSSDNKTMYFTETIRKKKKIILQIFQVEYINNKWQNKKALSINSDMYSCAHPSVTSDGKQLFFTSDMPNGYGGKDLYVSIKEGNIWGKPQNLGKKVNTVGNEMFPFINKNGVLYFSSDGHPGYGGLDIFSAIYSHDKWTKVTNKKKPLNSSGDDFSIVVHPTNDKLLLFSSNRGTQGNQDNIYKAIKTDLPADTIKGKISDALTEDLLDKSLVFLLVDSITGDTIARTVSNNKGEFSIVVPKKDESVDERNLILTVEKKGYERKVIDIDETYFETDKPLIKDINIELKVEIEEEKVLKFHNIYFEYGSAELNTNSKIVLDKVILMLKENKGIQIELSAHTDSRADADFNFELSKKRAENAKNYILLQNINSEQVIAKGYGESKLLNHCKDGVLCNENEYAVNRRIEIKILKL